MSWHINKNISSRFKFSEIKIGAYKNINYAIKIPLEHNNVCDDSQFIYGFDGDAYSASFIISEDKISYNKTETVIYYDKCEEKTTIISSP